MQVIRGFEGSCEVLARVLLVSNIDHTGPSAATSMSSSVALVTWCPIALGSPANVACYFIGRAILSHSNVTDTLASTGSTLRNRKSNGLPCQAFVVLVSLKSSQLGGSTPQEPGSRFRANCPRHRLRGQTLALFSTVRSPVVQRRGESGPVDPFQLWRRLRLRASALS